MDYCLEVEEISKNAYESSGKINAVKDVVIHKYFTSNSMNALEGSPFWST